MRYYSQNPAVVLLFFVLLWMACNSAGSRQKTVEDSLQYYPPTPVSLSKEEYRRAVRTAHAFFDSALAGPFFNGGFLVAKKGNIVFEAYRGTAHLNGKDSITASTPFHIASTSKTFTAAAIMLLVQENKLKLTDSLQRFFPGFPYKGVTVQCLLNHRSGLPNYAYFLEKTGWDRTKRVTNRDVLQVLMTGAPRLEFQPDRRFTYCNTNYVLLALLIEQLSGQSYAAFLQKRFFDPLQMTSTKVFSWSDSATATPSYRWNGALEPFTWLDETYGDKNIYSTPRDLLKWDQALYTEQLLNNTSKAAAFQPYSFERPGIHNYGLGWRMYNLANNKTVLYHNGWWHGNNACFFRVVTDSLTVVVLGNRYNQRIYKVKPLIEALTPIRFSYDNGDE